MNSFWKGSKEKARNIRHSKSVANTLAETILDFYKEIHSGMFDFALAAHISNSRLCYCAFVNQSNKHIEGYCE